MKLGGLGRKIAGAGAMLAVALPAISQQITSTSKSSIGREVAIARHLQDDEEFRITTAELIAYGKKLFCAVWTDQEGGGRPLTKGTGKALADPAHPLKNMRAFNRISGPDANSCAGCHNSPYGIPGGSGDFVSNVFVLGQRFDFVTFDSNDGLATRGSNDEHMQAATLQTIANSRKTTSLFGAGYLEMLARQITEDLQQIRDSVRPGQSKELASKGIHFGRISRTSDGLWDTSQVEGLARASLLSNGSNDPPNLIVRPWHQASNVVSLREFTNTAFNQHHGIQSTERFGSGTDPDGDGFVNELTRADVTAVALFQATLQVPGRVIPHDPEIENAVLAGEKLFAKVGCASCHISKLPLARGGWIFSEPGSYNAPGNLRTGQTQTLRVDLSSDSLPQPRLKPNQQGVIDVPAYTDFKLHDICGPDDNEFCSEPLDMNQSTWSPKFNQRNRRFLTRRLWGIANQQPYFHHGLFTTMRKAIMAHSGEALDARRSFEALTETEKNYIIEFLKTLQVLPPGTKALVVDENFHKREWPPRGN